MPSRLDYAKLPDDYAKQPDDYAKQSGMSPLNTSQEEAAKQTEGRRIIKLPAAKNAVSSQGTGAARKVQISHEGGEQSGGR